MQLRNFLSITVASLFAAHGAISTAMAKDASDVRHVVLISVDGMHQEDIDFFVSTHPQSAMARLVSGGASLRMR